MVVEEEGRAGRARRVPRVESELVEVVLGRLDLAIVADLVAEAEEGVLDLAPRLRDRVQVPERERVAGEGDVDDLLGERTVELRALELRAASLERALEPVADAVQRHARSRDRGPRGEPARARSCGRGSGRAPPRARRGSRRLRSRSVPRFPGPWDPPADCTIGFRERLRTLRGDLRRLGLAHDRGRSVLRRACARGRRAGCRARCRQWAGGDSGVTGDRPDARNRPLAGDAGAGARARRRGRRAAGAAGGRHARAVARGAGGAHLLPVSRAAPPADVGRPAAGVRAGRSLLAAGRPVRLERVRVQPAHRRGERRRVGRAGRNPTPGRSRARRGADRHHARVRRLDLALVGEPLRVGRV